MVDEDFVMGYACGFNDAGGGSGGGDVPTGDTVIYNDVTIAKQWNLTGTPFGIALFDVHSDRLVCGIRSASLITEIEDWDRLFIDYWVAMGLLYNGDIVTVVPLQSLKEALIVRGLPYREEVSDECTDVGGNATLRHTSTTSSNGTVTHNFYVDIQPKITRLLKTYYHCALKSENLSTVNLSKYSEVLSWKYVVTADGASITEYKPYWLFFPYTSSQYGLAGIPKGTSLQKLFHTGMLAETLKENLLNAGENITLEEV